MAPAADGEGVITLSVGGKTTTVPVVVSGLKAKPKADYVHDVTPILSKLGCNAGTCHGSAQGKNGFKLSLRGYDPLFDVRALTDDHGSRRINLASPDDSLMLLKPTGAVPHVGGTVFKPGEPYYAALRSWIADGAKLDRNSPKVSKIDVVPVQPGRPEARRKAANPRSRHLHQRRGPRRDPRGVPRNGQHRGRHREQVRPAHRDPSRRGPDPRPLRRGVRRHDPDRDGRPLRLRLDQPPAYNKIDELTAAKWQRMKIQAVRGLLPTPTSFAASTLDLTGLPPTADDVRAFLADTRDTRVKRDAVVDKLIGSPDFVEYWTNKWADLLQVNRKFLDVEGAVAFRNWIRGQVAANTPYDKFVLSILTATGSNKTNPPASYFKILREPAADDGEHDAALPGGSVQLQQVPRPPVRALDAGPVLPDGGLFRRRSA